MSRRFLTAAISTVAVMTGAAPLWAGNFTVEAPPDGAVFDEVFLTTLPAHTKSDVLVFDVNDLTFNDGVNITKTAGENTNLQFNGNVTFNTTTNKSLDINQLIFAQKNAADNSTHQLTVTGDELDVGDAEVIVNTDLTVNFTNNGAISTISKLTLGAGSVAPVNLTVNDDELLNVTALEIGQGGAVIDTGLQVGKAVANKNAPAPVGLAVTNAVTVRGQTTVDGKLSGGGGTNFIFAEESSILLDKGAIGSVLADNTKLTIDDKLLVDIIEKDITVTSFKPFDVASNDGGIANTFKTLAASLDVDDTGLNFRGGGEIAYDKDNGYLVFADYKGQAEMSGIPGYGVPFVEALEAAQLDGVNNHKALAVAIKGVAKSADVSEDLNTIMGNVPNAAIGAALSNNMSSVMSHLNSTLSPAMPGFAGPSGSTQGLWVTPGYSMTDITGDPANGYGDMEIKNPNVTIGYDRWLNERIKLGVFAAMSQPKTEGDYQTIDTKNMQAGLYGQAQLNYGINVNMGLGYSVQTHDAEREIPADILAGAAPFAAQKIDSSFDGNTMSAALEVSRLYPLAANSFIRPTIGYSYVATSIDGYSEKSSAAAPGDSLAQKVESTDMTMHLVRVGAEGGWSNDLTTVTGRLFWVGNMGDTQPKTQAALITDGSTPFNVIGAEYDKNMVNIGLGVNYVPPQTQGLTFGLNYDALLGSNAKNHSLSLMMRYEF